MYCMYDEEKFDDWIIKGISQEKGYPKINLKKLPFVRKSYLAFINWLFIKFSTKQNFVIDWNKILKFTKVISKMKANATIEDYNNKIFNISFCENIVENWKVCHDKLHSHTTNFSELTFIVQFSQIIQKCKDWTYEVKLDSCGNFIEL